jgi:hypothetical protein
MDFATAEEDSCSIELRANIVMEIASLRSQ